MAFSEQLKLTVRQRAHFCCCLCHALGVEIHHIIPEAEDGPDDDDNAAPLCPSCHETYGANPTKRKFIREVRDFWYQQCSKVLSFTSVDIQQAISNALKDIATKEDIERLSVQNSSYVLGHSSGDNRATVDQLSYSFTREEYVHPRIVQELNGWISDPYSAVVSIDLVSGNRSNRFYGDFWVRKLDGRQWVGWTGDKQEFSYSHIATSPSGIHMVDTADWGGGSGIFRRILLFAFDRDRALEQGDDGALLSRERILLKILGSVSLGDRYSGKITYSEGYLLVGPDIGWFERGDEASKKIPIR